MTFSIIKDTDTGWECYQCDSNSSLSYFIHRKCASSTYIKLFNKLGWELTDTTTIDWDKDTVFSHIKQPLVKHRKGIVEACGVMGVFDEVSKSKNLIKMMTHAMSFDIHSWTIEKMLGQEHALLVKWIPIDKDVDHKQATINFIRQNGGLVPLDIEQWFLNMPSENLSIPNEITLYNLLMEQPVPAHILRYIDFDTCLYDSVVTPPPHILAQEYYQTRVQDLLKQGISQQTAEEIVDQEVYDNKHLSGKKNSA